MTEIKLKTKSTSNHVEYAGNKGVLELMQRQVDHEFENERLYLSMSIWLHSNGFIQTAKFFSRHSVEERGHGMDFINAMLKQKVAIKTPYTTDIERDFTDVRSLLVIAVEQEEKTSKMILELHKKAIEENSLFSEVSTKYVEEQMEETQLFNSLLNLYDLCDGSKIDFELEVLALKDSKNNKYKMGML
jgi:ferritin